MGEKSVVLVGNLNSTSSCCRICHEEEFDVSQRLESPCGCSGTAKFAHRGCIQRWCDEKGNTTCEICLQKYGPGYTATPKRDEMRQEVVTIRLEIPREEHQADETLDALLDTEYPDCSPADRTASCCKSVAMIITVILLVRHMLAVLSGEAGKYPFTLPTIIALKSCGTIVPIYIIIWAITGIRNSIRKYHHHQRIQHLRRLRYRGHTNDQMLHITVDIQSQ